MASQRVRSIIFCGRVCKPCKIEFFTVIQMPCSIAAGSYVCAQRRTHAAILPVQRTSCVPIVANQIEREQRRCGRTSYLASESSRFFSEVASSARTSSVSRGTRSSSASISARLWPARPRPRLRVDATVPQLDVTGPVSSIRFQYSARSQREIQSRFRKKDTTIDNYI
eukprot:6192444-Pleurochrysis_carterae.AAC.2